VTVETILKVLTPAASYDLTTLEIVKDELGITDSSSDTTLARWIAESSHRIAAYTERVWGLETVRQLWRFDHHQFQNAYFGWENRANPQGLRFDRYPIATITSLVEDDVYTLVEGQDYEVDQAAGVVYRIFQGGVPNSELRWRWRRKVVATYTAGYQLPAAVPLRLQQATTELIKGRWGSRTRDPALRSFSIPGVIEKTYWGGGSSDGDLPPEIVSILDGLIDRQF
jgi:hypothetical protein